MLLQTCSHGQTQGKPNKRGIPCFPESQFCLTLLFSFICPYKCTLSDLSNLSVCANYFAYVFCPAHLSSLVSVQYSSGGLGDIKLHLKTFSFSLSIFIQILVCKTVEITSNQKYTHFQQKRIVFTYIKIVNNPPPPPQLLFFGLSSLSLLRLVDSPG